MDIKKFVIQLLGNDSYNKATKISFNDIRHYDSLKRSTNDFVHIFQVESQSNYYYYDVSIIIKNNNVISYSCDCEQFRKYHTCKHIAACFLHCSDIIFIKPPDPFEVADNILSLFYKPNNNVIKEEIGLDIELDFITNKPSFKLYVGLKKKYVINSQAKFEGFMDAYLNKKDFYFGANFTFSSKCHYMNSDDEKLLMFLFGYDKENSYYRNDVFSLNERELITLISMIENRKFRIKNLGIVNGISYSMPTSLGLNYSDGTYKLYIDDIENYIFLDYNYKYVFYNHCLYVIPNDYNSIIKKLADNNINELVFKKEKLDVFKDGLLQNIKNNIVIEEGIDDIVIAGTPLVSLYFDFNKDSINCDVKFDYKDHIINFFDNDENIVRDRDFENEVINNLNNYNFISSNKKFILSGIDDIGHFFSQGLNELSTLYSVFTSKKIDNVNILNKSVIKSNFSIGKDGIMSYNFETDNIDLNELGDVLSSLRKNKRYYKLKNGNIIDFSNNEDIQELNNIFNDLDISNKNLNDGTIIIPKYRALYIDSLKRNKYKSIKTDNSFDKFIHNFNKFKDIDIEFSDFDKTILRDYQRDGVKWLYTLYKCDLGGILADEMGLGKSLQVICFIKQILMKKKDAKILIVCPTSLVYNWKKEFDKFGSDLKYVTVADNKQKRIEVMKDFNNYNIFITSYGLVRNDNDEYEKIDFELCVIDEAQAIKNYQAGMTREIKKIKAKTKIALTGTPLENSILELWSIFDFIMPGYLNNITKFKENYGIKDIDKDSLDKLSKLNYQIKPFILRRKKSDVIKDLPDKIENNIYLDLPDLQKALYLNVLKESENEFNELVSTEGFKKARFKILQLLMRLRQICVDPHILFDNYNGESIKMEKLLEVVSDYIKDGHKILIFSSFKMVIDRVKEMFNKNGISNYMIAGDVKSKTRMELVDKFNSDDTNCFLITLKSGGTGLNLTSADVVIHLDIWWNPQVENQATDRAHRIGQTKKVSVIKFITKGTIEEKIIELQNKKKILSDNLIEGKDNSELLSSLSEKEIKSLLSYSFDE